MAADITIVAAGIVAAAQSGLADEAATALSLPDSPPGIAQAEVLPGNPTLETLSSVSHRPLEAAQEQLSGHSIAAVAAPNFSIDFAPGRIGDPKAASMSKVTAPAASGLAAIEADEAKLIREQSNGPEFGAIAVSPDDAVVVTEGAISQENHDLQDRASGTVNEIPIPEAIADSSGETTLSQVAPMRVAKAMAETAAAQSAPDRVVHDPSAQSDPWDNGAVQARWTAERDAQRALALDRFEAELAQGVGAMAAPIPPVVKLQASVQSPAEPVTVQPGPMSPERQILLQVMLERTETEFLRETVGDLSESGTAEMTAEAIAIPDAIGSGPAQNNIDQDDISQDDIGQNDIGQITSVSQLRDVQPTDWAYQATQSLIERYGCVAGYPDPSFRGDRALSRYEFAAGLHACLERVTELLPIVNAGDSGSRNIGAGGGFAAQADIAVIQQLSEQFQLELGQLRDRTGGLEQRQQDLEAQQFSTTTKLYGQAIFGLRGSNDNDVDLFPVDGNPERTGAGDVTFGGSTELTLANSFSGRDLLLTTLQASNLASSASTQFTNMGRLAFEGDTDNQLLLTDLSYRFAATPSLGLIVGTHGVNPTNTFRGISPLESSGDGALSRLGQRNPILELGSGRGGAGFDWQMSPNLSLQGVYSAAAPSQTGSSSGLFNGGYVTGGQFSAGLGQRIDLGVHYLHSYSPNGSLGIGIGDTQVLSPFAPQGSSFRTHAVGATAAWRPSQRLSIGGWGGWTSSRPTDLSGRVQTTNWMGFAQVNDLFRQGNALGLLVGQPPKITSSNLPVGFNFPEFSDGGGQGGRRDTALHLEAFYRAQLNEQISVTPGIVVINNPNHNADNEMLVVGAMRTTFRF